MQILSKKQKIAYSQLINNDLLAYLFFGGAAGGGKSWLGCFWIHRMCVNYPGVRYFIGRDSLKDTRESVLITWSKLTKMYGFVGYWKFGDNSIDFQNGSKVIFLDLSYYPQKDPFFERLGSKEYTGGWIEEAGEVMFDAFDVLKSRIGRHMNEEYSIKSKVLITANPKKGWLYNTFYEPFIKNELPDDYAFIQSLNSDNPHLPDEYRKNLDTIKDKIKRQRLLLGMFDYDDDDNSLIPYNKIMDLFSNTFVDDGEMFISSDIAITNDSFVCIVWSGLKIIDISCIKNVSKPQSVLTSEGEWINKVDFTPLINEFDRLTNKYRIGRSNIVYDADGIGHKLRTFLSGAIGLNNNARPTDPAYYNLKSQLYYMFAELANSNEIYIQSDMSTELKDRLVKEIGAIKRSSDIGEKLKIMPKNEVKMILGHSPDLTDAIVYRLLFWITRKK